MGAPAVLPLVILLLHHVLDLQVGNTRKVMIQNIDALRTIFYYYATLDEVSTPTLHTRANTAAHD